MQRLGPKLSFLNTETKSIENHSARFLHLVYVFRQRFIIDLRNYFLFIFKSFVSTLIFIWILYILCQYDYKLFEQNASFPIPHPSNGIMFLQQNALSRQLLAAGRQYIMQGAKEIGADLDIYEYIRHYMVDHRMLSDINILTGAIFTEEKVEILFNDKRQYTVPNGLAHLMNSLAFGFVGPDTKIIVKMELLQFSTVQGPIAQNNVNSINLVLATSISFCFCFIWTFPLLFINLNKSSRPYYTELCAGMRISVLILAFFIYDSLSSMLALIPLNISILFFQWDALMDTEIFLLNAYVIFGIGICVLSINILISLRFTDLQNCYMKTVTFYSFGIIIYLVVNEWQQVISLNKLTNILLDFHPLYCLLHNLMIISSITELKKLCSDEQIFQTSTYSEECQKFPNCCGMILIYYICFYFYTNVEFTII
ncbi:uncharacterized protein LOC116656458 [Drosophila ananassae]|uniref:uncharacterized protein LOC116656458 n=1 Tax=Drosophila ananassae TaxID=7217 RepID=UPI0013A5E50F|nr:uncharacterized protein LOC116656458 [Drosophila ananassae]